MSPNSLENPFHISQLNQESPAHLMKTHLPSAEAQALTEALGEDEPSKSEPQQDLPPVLDISMSGKEQKEVEKEPLWIKEDYIKWAESFGKDEAWVNETFKFQPDGTTVVEEDLLLRGTKIEQLPIGLIEVTGKLIVDNNPSLKLNGYPKRVGENFYCQLNDLSSLQGMPEEVRGFIGFDKSNLSSLVGLPRKVTGGLFLSNNQLENLDGISREISGSLFLGYNKKLTSLEALRGVKIGQNLWLRNIPATTIPAGIEIRGDIYIHQEQRDLIVDAQAKGYQIKVIMS
ncbi:MAG: hypothetical protein UU48_C0026G0002 [Candidatus Uhrbacteria bacterium GW2011_GWF2_41_16]|uniref:Uncharacterized protein n=1 Tax=Candidatus Uhrbacteria bacterium GW2011_GWF2_41_16 TaxID=1618997 RepID=A0A0G0Y8W5_9BACT|nr:MAG: hypothetical protein UU48_C0026G0002 [Candidatus Uhrbacteria bacterium GW2011_GWF2_41_16]